MHHFPENEIQALSLTTRQLHVLKLIAQRSSHKEIATALGISVTRVNQHVRSLKDILRVNSLSELADVYRRGQQLQLQDKPESLLQDRSHSDAHRISRHEPKMEARNRFWIKPALIASVFFGLLCCVIVGLAAAKSISDFLVQGRTAPAG